MGLDAFTSSRNQSKKRTWFKSERAVERRNISSLLISANWFHHQFYTFPLDKLINKPSEKEIRNGS
jgi:hypothetical protein